MKTLQDIKNQYVKEQGYEDWEEMSRRLFIPNEIEYLMDEICIRAQKAALEKAVENAKIVIVKQKNTTIKIEAEDSACIQDLLQEHEIHSYESIEIRKLP